VTLTCGHTFCRDCCEGALNRGRRSQCPLCRADIDATTLPSETVALRQLVQHCFPDKYAAAVAAKEVARRSAADARAAADDSSSTGASALFAGIPWSRLPAGGEQLCRLPIMTFSPELLWPHQPIRMMIVEPHFSATVQELLRSEVKLLGIHAHLAPASDQDDEGEQRSCSIVGLDIGSMGTLVAIGEVEELRDSTGRTQHVLHGRGVARYVIASLDGNDASTTTAAYAEAENGSVVQYRPGRVARRHCGLCHADVNVIVDDDATHEPEPGPAEQAVLPPADRSRSVVPDNSTVTSTEDTNEVLYRRCTKRALSVWRTLHPEARQALEREFGDLGAAHTRQHPFRVSCWLASSLRLDQACSPTFAQLLHNDQLQRRRLFITRSTRERMEVCMEVLSRFVSFTDDDEVDTTASNYAIDHPSELFAIGQQPPAIVRLIQHSPNLALLSLVGIALAWWAHLHYNR
jgi:hypothetical protein